MEFVLGLYVGLIAGFIVRGWLNKIEYKIRHDGILGHGSKNKRH